MTDEAETTALSEFDWFRPVDPEDIFLSYVDSMIQGLEELKPGKVREEQVQRLIKELENAVPSSRAYARRDSRIQDESSLCSKPSVSINTVPRIITSETKFDGVDAAQLPRRGTEERQRQESIVKTPLQFYQRSRWIDEGYVSASPSESSPSGDVQRCLAAGSTSPNWR